MLDKFWEKAEREIKDMEEYFIQYHAAVGREEAEMIGRIMASLGIGGVGPSIAAVIESAAIELKNKMKDPALIDSIQKVIQENKSAGIEFKAVLRLLNLYCIYLEKTAVVFGFHADEIVKRLQAAMENDDA